LLRPLGKLDTLAAMHRKEIKHPAEILYPVTPEKCIRPNFH